MKILHSVPNFFPYSYGGGQVYVQAVAKELSRRGHEVCILSSKPWEGNVGTHNLSTYEYDKSKIIAIELNPSATHLLDAYTQVGPTLMDALRAAVQEARPEIVHLSGFKPALTRICKELQIPFVVTAHHPGFVCPGGTLLTDEEEICRRQASDKVCIRCCSRQKIRPAWLSSCLLVMHDKIIFPLGRIIGSRKRAPYLARGLAYPWFIHKSIESKRVVFRHAPIIIAPSQATAMFLALNGVPQERIRVVPHGIEPMPRLPFERINGRRIRFGYIGSVNRAKGFHILLQALERIEPQDYCDLHIFGGAQNPWDNAFVSECIARYLGKARIINHGYISHDELPNAFKEIDILVVPSIYLEVFGLVILEAFSAGRPVIVSKSGGPEELVRHGIDGFVVERNNSQALSEAMQEFMDHPELIFEMSSRISHVKTMKEYVDELENIYAASCWKQ
jgi:glycosyltransferase involved in cell wall biosynthesis